MVNIAGSLPKGDANGLDAHSRVLADALVAGNKFFVVGVVKTHSVKTGEDLAPVPTVQFTKIELVELDTELETAAADLLVAAQDRRRGGAGQQTFDMPKPEKEGEPEVLALAEGSGYHFIVRDLPAGRFGLYLCTQHVEDVKKRGNLLRSELGEIAPGDYQMHELPESLRPIAEVLIEEWETNTGTSVLSDDGVVDAEVVDDEADELEGGDSE